MILQKEMGMNLKGQAKRGAKRRKGEKKSEAGSTEGSRKRERGLHIPADIV